MINKLTCSSFLIFLALFSPEIYAEDSEQTHFGTIFVQDIEYDQSTEMENLNFLTDDSQQQKTLEELNRDIEKRNASLKKTELEKKKREDEADKKLGILRNNETKKQIIYFLELRPYEGNPSQAIFSESAKTAAFRHSLMPGQIVKVVDIPDQYVHKLRSDRANQGLWKKLAIHGDNPDSMYVYYDWKNYDTITSHEQPIEIDVLVPRDRNTIPVFAKPGIWTYNDCSLSETLCIDNIDHHTKAYLFDTTYIKLNNFRQSQSQYKLFYKVGYKVQDKTGVIRHKVGWIPGDMARRKITQLPKVLLGKRGPAGNIFETDKERLDRLSKYYIFNQNAHSTNHNVSRFVKQTPGKSAEVFLNTLAFDGIASANMFSLEQSFLDDPITQYGMGVGIGMFAPIFVDLEVQGTFLLTVPIANDSEKHDPSFLFKGEQWLLYTTPWGFNKLPLKFGLGGYYQSMFAAEDDYGFQSLVGFQIKAMLESDGWWGDFRYGPTGQDFGFQFENRELGLSFGYRIDEDLKYDSWTLFLDFADTNFINAETKSQTSFQVIQAGLRKQF